MSPRSFARHFRAATGTTPHAWLLAQRLTRGHFAGRFGTSPQAYRRTFHANIRVAAA